MKWPLLTDGEDWRVADYASWASRWSANAACDMTSMTPAGGTDLKKERYVERGCDVTADERAVGTLKAGE